MKNTIILKYKEEDSLSIIAYRNYISKHIKLGNKIPARVLKKYFSFFNNEERLFKNELDITIESIKKDVFNRFKNDKDFNFSRLLNAKVGVMFSLEKSTLVNQPNEFKMRFYLENLIDIIFNDIQSRYKKDMPKKDFTNLIIESINDYFLPYQKDSKKIFSAYKRSVLIGYISLKFKYVISKEISELDKNEITNHLLHQSIKHYTKNI